MRVIVVMFALIGTMTAGCFQVAPQPPLPPTTMSSWGPAGGFHAFIRTVNLRRSCDAHGRTHFGERSMLHQASTTS